ncbi:alpha-amylase family glycosyl hydrolase [Arcticibacter eurypsychrophilus]|uniref:alpha-amylase family glycosyl hydrolase n=1 Tax=Arcticibacter eurypsychrophilus TaxID=1434752 RepID=UPI00084DE269|nr:alpha-amylase family glycosyl hydrolase [Arcticibacter eurypsychrophilus]
MNKSCFLLFMLLSTLSYTVSKGQTNQKSPQQVQYGKPFQKVPDRRDVTLYQVNMRTFSKEGSFKGVIARLDSIKALGANVIYLMPIYPVGIVNSVNSPYCVKDYKAINKEFGDLNDLRTLVEGAHVRNMAVILDWVANHTSFDHVWTVNKSWYLQDSVGNIISPPKTGWNDVAQLDFTNNAMRSAMISAMKYWVLSANVDGFRCDYSDGPPLAFWKQALDTLKAIPNHKLLMLSEGTRTDHFKAGFDYNFGFRFFENMKEVYEHNRSVLSIDSMNVADYRDTSPSNLMVRYTSNHDVNSSDGTALDLFGGKKGSMAAFVVVSYMKSVPMIYNGQEVGTPYRLTFPFKTTTIDWSVNPDVTAEYKKILALRNSSDAIRRGELTSYSSTDVCAFTKVLGNEKVLIISNLRNKPIQFTVPEKLKNTGWKDAFNSVSKEIKTVITLEPYSYYVLKAV